MPENYVFVPKGDVYVTRHCRSDTKESSQVVFAVYVSLATTYQHNSWLNTTIGSLRQTHLGYSGS